MALDPLDRKRFNFLSALTALAVLIHLGAAGAALALGRVEWVQFLAASGTTSGLLIGYWLRGANND